MGGSAESDRSYHLEELDKCHAINHLRAKLIKRGMAHSELAQAFRSPICPSPVVQNAMGGSARCKISPAASHTPKPVNSR
jgi:hypothetical protein